VIGRRILTICAFGTIDARVRMVSRFQAFTNSYPWQWSPSDFEEWVEELRSRGQARSSLRTLGWAVRTFLGYVCDPVYGWAEECTERFGTHPVQICTRWNTIAHVVDSEGRPTRRALTRQELQDLFDAADDDVARARRLGRKGWLSLFRDATLFKVAYAWPVRRIGAGSGTSRRAARRSGASGGSLRSPTSWVRRQRRFRNGDAGGFRDADCGHGL
jgi:hypothetical protein